MNGLLEDLCFTHILLHSFSNRMHLLISSIFANNQSLFKNRLQQLIREWNCWKFNNENHTKHAFLLMLIVWICSFYKQQC
jgi:hypothetical protein